MPKFMLKISRWSYKPQNTFLKGGITLKTPCINAQIIPSNKADRKKNLLKSCFWY